MTKYLITGAALLAVVALVLFLIHVSTDETAPAQPTGIELDIDRSKPRPKMDQPKPAPKPAPRSKR